MSNCKLVAITPDAEKLIAYCARVSNPNNQDNPDITGLLRYCIREKHWSVFEMANMVLEVNTTLDISHQIVRHRSFSFQQMSRRYSSDALGFDFGNPRRQDTKNRQNSIDDLGEDTKRWFEVEAKYIAAISEYTYDKALERGIAKECARKLLPQAATTRLYMNGTIRSWIHYIELRTGNGTQKEHMDVANSAKVIFCEQLPVIAAALDWARSCEDYGQERTIP